MPLLALWPRAGTFCARAILPPCAPILWCELYAMKDVCLWSVWVPCVALPSGGGSSAGSSPLCGSPVGGVLPCRVPVFLGICSSSCLSLALTLSQRGYTNIFTNCLRGSAVRALANWSGLTPYRSNLPRGFQRFGFDNHFRAGCFSDLGYGLDLRMVKSSPGGNPKPRLGPILA